MKTIFKYLVIPLFLTTGCEVEHSVPVRPEARIVQSTSPPFENGVWINNEYRWDGNTYIIVPAHWEKSKGTWIAGYWKSVRNGYTWIPGHWK